MIKLKDCECTNCDTVNVIDPSESQFECGECHEINEQNLIQFLDEERDIMFY